MGKIIKLYYNGEVGWDATVKQVHTFFKIQQEVIQWLDFADSNGVTNRKKIFVGYSSKTRFRLDAEDENGNLLKSDSIIQPNYPVPWPIELHVDSELITRDILINQSNFVSQIDETSTFGKKKDDTDQNGNYAFSTNLKSFYERTLYDQGLYNTDGSDIVFTEQRKREEVDKSFTSGMAYKEKRNMTVWVWCKSLSDNKNFDKNSVFDLTPFIQSVNTNVVESGGTFSITLAPVIGRLSCAPDSKGKNSPNGRWFPDPLAYVKFKHNGQDNFVFKSFINEKMGFKQASWKEDSKINSGTRFNNTKLDSRVALTDQFEPTVNVDEMAYIRSDFFFTYALAENDVVFISFRESVKPNDVINDFFVSVDDIQYRNWDMIALIDSNSVSMTAENTDVTINITGRDLMKLFIEDGSFFFHKSYSNPDSTETAFNNVDLPNSGDKVNTLNRILDEESVSGVNRLITTGMLETLFNPEARNVGFIMNLLVSRLANIEICPSKVFDSYGQRRTRFQVEIDEPVVQNGGQNGSNIKNQLE